VSFIAEVISDLNLLDERGLLRRPRVVGSSQAPKVLINGRWVVSLCSNNYLGLANHPLISEAAIRALRELGMGAAGSRHIQGTMELHRSAEARLSHFVGLESALLFSSGYAANTGTIGALAGSRDVIFSDELNHASIIDGCRLSRASVLVYRHLDTNHLEELLFKHRASYGKALVITEALFSVDGDLAPLMDLRTICDRYDAALMVDEAHSLGVYGVDGTGLCAKYKISPDVLIGTLGKAFGVAGAFVAGATPIVALVENRARSYVFSTASPPSLAAATIAATELVQAASESRVRLFSHANRLREALGALGYRIPKGDSPIIALHIGDPVKVMKYCADLLEHGVFVHGIRPPTVPPGTSRLRVTPMATHESQHIDFGIDAFRSLASASNLETRVQHVAPSIVDR
jgi:8-amino-7-oxononanoate synthase